MTWKDNLREKTDDALVIQIGKDNRLAFNVVFERYWDKLYQAAFKLLRDEDAAKDVVQEVFFDFWNRRAHHRIINLPAFLYQAVRFQSLKQLQKTKLLDIHEAKFESVLKANTTEEELDLNQLEDRLGRSLEQLPEKYRRVFELSRVHNMSNREIALHLQMSQRTVEWYLHTILKHLKTSLTTILFILTGLLKL